VSIWGRGEGCGGGEAGSVAKASSTDSTYGFPPGGYFICMADRGENQPGEHGAQPPPAEPTIEQPEQADVKPEIQAGKPKSEDSKSDWRPPLISALAALLGALIGGLSSYIVAQHNNSDTAEATLKAKRQTDYANYLSAETNLQGVENTLGNYFSRFDPSIVPQIQDAANKYYDLKDKVVNTDYVVALSCSRDVDEARTAIVQQQGSIDKDFHSLADDSRGRQQLNSGTVQDYVSEVDGLTALFANFTNVARNVDLNLPPLGSEPHS
jgi:hypothetical protein